jgi:hypothetical protein
VEDGSRYLDYASNTDCNWLIDPEIPDYDSIRNFNIEFQMLKLDTGDTLTLFDGNSAESPLLGKFTGWEIPEPVFSTTDQIFLNCISNESEQADGWLLNLVPQSPVYCHDTVIFTSGNGIISDGSGSKKYIENSDCRWLIKTQNIDSIRFTFLEVDFELNYDYLQFTYSEEGVNKNIRFTGNELPAPFTLYSDSVFILFHSDYRDNCQGFSFQYNSSSHAVIENADSAVTIFPNPFSTTLKICRNTHLHANIRYEILNLNGQPEIVGSLPNPEEVLNTEHLLKGVHFLKIYSAQAISVKKIIKF